MPLNKISDKNNTIVIYIKIFSIFVAVIYTQFIFMFRLKDENIPLPEKYPVVKRVLPTAKKDGVDKFGNFIIREDFDICPQHGLQEEVVASECNLIFLAGEATMGKALSINEFVLSKDG